MGVATDGKRLGVPDEDTLADYFSEPGIHLGGIGVPMAQPLFPSRLVERTTMTQEHVVNPIMLFSF